MCAKIQSFLFQVEPSRVVIRGARTFGCVLMKDFLRELAKKVKANNTGKILLLEKI